MRQWPKSRSSTSSRAKKAVRYPIDPRPSANPTARFNPAVRGQYSYLQGCQQNQQRKPSELHC